MSTVKSFSVGDGDMFYIKPETSLMVGRALAPYGMRRFRGHYGREVFVHFLELPDALPAGTDDSGMRGSP